MRGVFSATVHTTAVTTPVTMLYLAAPANKVVEIISAGIFNTDNDTGEQIKCELKPISGVAGSAWASGVSPLPMEGIVDGQSSDCTVSGVSTTEPSYVPDRAYDVQGVSNLGGYEFLPPPEGRVVLGGTQAVGLRTVDTITSSALTAQIVYREIG